MEGIALSPEPHNLASDTPKTTRTSTAQDKQLAPPQGVNFAGWVTGSREGGLLLCYSRMRHLGGVASPKKNGFCVCGFREVLSTGTLSSCPFSSHL